MPDNIFGPVLHGEFSPGLFIFIFVRGNAASFFKIGFSMLFSIPKESARS